MYRALSLAVVTASLLPALASAEDITLTLKDHQFSPKEITVAKDTDVTLIVKNEDSTPAEFESHTLHREKIIGGGKQAVIKLSGLKAGRYEFFDEFHESTAQGTLIVE